MNDNDYIILFDQNGSPYIAHASLSAMRQRTAGALRAVGNAANTAREGVGRGVRATHKYIDKVVENGKTRYFYTQEELKAYYNEQRGKVNQKVGEAQEKASAARMRMERIGNEFKDKAQNTASEAKASAKAYKEYQDANKARDPKRITEAWSELQKHPAAMKAEMSRRKVAEAQESVENVAYDVKDKANEVSGKVSSKIKKTAHDAKKTTQDIAEDAKETAEKASAQVKKAAKETKEMLKEKLSSTNGTPGNGVDDNGETRSMLGSYAFNIPSDPKKLKEWADGGKQKAQEIMAEVEKEFEEFKKDYEAGKYGQTEMWIAQGIMDDLQDEMAEWEALSNMDEQALAQLFGPLTKKK